MKTNVLFFTIACLTVLFGCSNKLVEQPTGEVLQLQISVDGITDPEEASGGTASRNARNQSRNTIRRASNSIGDAGFVANYTTSLESMEARIDDRQSSVTLTDNNATMSTINRATTPMPDGYRYRILVYNKATGQFWRTIQATSGRVATLEAERGVTYTWYAYSYNNTDDIPSPGNINNPSIETSVEKDFLYATGEMTIANREEARSYMIGIVFQHKVTQLRVRIDAASLAEYGAINHLNASFDRNNYLKKGQFNIKSNQISQIEVVPTEMIFNAPSRENTWERSFYTVDPAALSTYRIVLNDLPMRFFGVNADIANRNLATYRGVASRPTFVSDFSSPAPTIGQRLTTNIQLSYLPDALRILHISSNARFGYSLQLGPSWDFLNSKENFGDSPESLVKLRTFPGEQSGWIGAGTTDNSANWIRFASNNAIDSEIANRLAATNRNNRPHIVIIGYNATTIRPVVGEAINRYLDEGGVVVMMLQNADNNNTTRFFNNLFNVSNIELVSSGSGGAMYPIVGNNPNDEILNGVFGDVRGKLWGEDAGTTLGVFNVPTNQITTYSFGQAINRRVAADRRNIASRVTMFKHNTKNFFFIGDGGFVSYNGGNSARICPYDFDPISKRPLAKPFGNRNAGTNYAARSQEAYNSVIIANVMAWAVKRAELQGLREWRYAAPPAS